jgi:hypothetical protein
VDLPEPDVDEQLLTTQLEAVAGQRGLVVEVAVVPWNDTSVRWSDWDLAIVRSAWDYPWHHAEFKSWLVRTAAQTTLLNPASVMEWNLDKRYLRWLERQSINIVPSIWIDSPLEVMCDGRLDAVIDQIPEADEWSQIVVKPCVSAGSWRTVLVDRQGASDWRIELQAAVHELDGQPGMIQAYQESVTTYGERSLIYIEGKFSHAIRKAPRFAGDEESVSAGPVPASASELRLADAVLSAVPSARPEDCGQPPQLARRVRREELLYARIDLIPGPDGAPRLAELELIEPSLFLIQCPFAANQLACAIIRHTEQAQSV